MSDMTDTSSIDAVAASLMESPEVEAPEDEIVEASDEDEADEQLEADDDTTEDNADDVEDEEEDIEQDDEPEEPEQALFTVKVDGKPKQVTLTELQRGYSGQAFINQNLETLAQAKKQMQEEYSQIQQERQFLADFRQRAESGQVLTPPKPPSRELFQQDPIGYMEAKLSHDDAMAEYQQQQQQMTAITERQRADQNRQHQAYLQSQMQILQERVPEFADPKTASKYRDKMVQAGIDEYGFSADELTSEGDARRLSVLSDAIKFREQQKAAGIARQRAETARPVVKPGVRRPAQASEAKRAKDAQSRMRKTGSVDDVAKFLLS
jgi:hypothetical protein|tara:strand:+ start:2985 stop:3953 length:969 start_codon:yes stop_codon:yes gene_type:complete